MRQGHLIRIRRGVYTQTQSWMQAYPMQRFGLTAEAVAQKLPEAVLCRETALYVWDLPLVKVPQNVHVRAKTRGHARTVPQPPMTGGLSTSEFTRQAAERGIESVTEHALRGFGTEYVVLGRGAEWPSSCSVHTASGEVMVEPLCFALADTVPHMAFTESVVVLDAALRGTSQHPAVSLEDLRSAAELFRWKRPSRYRWEQALAFATPVSESPGESLARALFHQLGFTAPQLQTSLEVDGRRYRLDFEWEEGRIVGEFDGWAKYQEGGREMLRQEKLREDDIRSTGRRVVRMYWEDLLKPDRLRRKLERAGVPRREAASPSHGPLPGRSVSA